MATSSDDMCTICLSDIAESGTTTLPCRHTFCRDCIYSYLDEQASVHPPCPNCRRPFDATLVILDISPHEETDNSSRNRMINFANATTRSDTKPRKTTAKCQQNGVPVNKEKLDKAVSDAFEDMDRLQAEADAAATKADELECTINERHDAIMRAAQRYRRKAFETLRAARAENEDAIKRRRERLSKFLRAREECLEPGNENMTTSTFGKRMSSRYGEEFLRADEKSTAMLVVPVLQCNESFAQLQESIRLFIGSVEKTTMSTPVLPEMTVMLKFDRKTYEDSFSEILSLCHSEGEKSGAVSIAYVAEEEKKQLVKVSESKEILKRTEKIDIEKYLHPKCYEPGELMQPSLTPGVSSSYSKSTKVVHFRLNSGYMGQGEIRRVQILSSNPLKIKGKTVQRVTCGRHRAFDADEDGKLFVVLEEAQSLGENCKVRLFKRNSSHSVATYQPPQQPFQPKDLVLHNLNGERVLLVADGATDKIHVIRIKDNRLVFLRYLAVEACLLSQPCVLEIDVHNRLWAACRDGKVFAFACSPVADAEANSPTECSPRRSFGLTAAAKPAAKKSLNAFCLLPFGTIPTTEI